MITLEEAKFHLRIDGNHEDADIRLRLALAESIVFDYVSGSDLEANNNMHGYDVVKAAILLVLGELYMNREADSNPLSGSIKALLERQRRPALA